MNRMRIVRGIEAADYAGLVTFLEENNIDEITRFFHPFLLTASIAQEICVGFGPDQYFVIIWDNRIIGLSMLRWHDGFLIPSLGIVIDHRYHNRGIGKKLLAFTIKRAGEIGCHRIRLSVYADNPVALQIFHGTGFVEVDRFSIPRAGNLKEKIIMVKEIKV